MKPFNASIQWSTGAMSKGVFKTRRVSDMKSLFHDQAAAEYSISQGDPIVYQYTTIELPEESSHVLYGTTTIYPGQVGTEYFMTKGHYHELRDTGEVYLCVKGVGRLIMETESGDTDILDMFPGSVSYVPPQWAHRVCNVGDEPLMFFAAFPGHAGHDYGTIDQTGFRIRVENHGGKPQVILGEQE